MSASKQMAATGMTASERLASLRGVMEKHGVDAYIVPTADSHNSEYPCGHDRRRAYISGFSGSAGTALITKTQALLWTEGRYFLQEAEELDCTCWTLMKQGTAECPTMPDWLRKNHTQVKKFSADSSTLSVSLWKALTSSAVEFLETPGNFVDLVWESETEPSALQPPIPEKPITVLPMTLAGKTVAAKLKDLRTRLAGLDNFMPSAPADCILLTETPDTAWLFNLGGDDFDFSPMLSFTMLTQDSVEIFCHEKNLTPEARKQLEENKVSIRPYDAVADALKALCPQDKSARVPRFLMDRDVCVALYKAVQDPEANVTLKTNYVQIAKVFLTSMLSRHCPPHLHFPSTLSQEMNNKKLPAWRDAAAVATCCGIARDLNEKSRAAGSSVSVDEIDEEVVANVVNFSAVTISPVTSFAGGIAAQEGGSNQCEAGESEFISYDELDIEADLRHHSTQMPPLHPQQQPPQQMKKIYYRIKAVRAEQAEQAEVVSCDELDIEADLRDPQMPPLHPQQQPPAVVPPDPRLEKLRALDPRILEWAEKVKRESGYGMGFFLYSFRAAKGNFSLAAEALAEARRRNIWPHMRGQECTADQRLLCSCICTPQFGRLLRKLKAKQSK